MSRAWLGWRKGGFIVWLGCVRIALGYEVCPHKLPLLTPMRGIAARGFYFYISGMLLTGALSFGRSA